MLYSYQNDERKKENKMKEKIREYIRENHDKVAIDFYTADGWKIIFEYIDGKINHHLIQTNSWPMDDETVVHCVECPGIGNLDGSVWTEHVLKINEDGEYEWEDDIEEEWKSKTPNLENAIKYCVEISGGVYPDDTADDILQNWEE
jgi:hypothetical protein